MLKTIIVKPAYVVTTIKGPPGLSSHLSSLGSPEPKYSANEHALRVTCLKQPIFVFPLDASLRQGHGATKRVLKIRKGA